MSRHTGYWHVVVATGSRLVTTAGPAGNFVGRGDHLAQARQTLSDLELALEAVGAKESDVVKTTHVYVIAEDRAD